ncbi:MAG: methyltransferase [Fulvimarina sp.]|nr:methyltransferase [Fulvimarina sp.]
MPASDDIIGRYFRGDQGPLDIMQYSQWLATIETAEYYNQHARTARAFPNKNQLHKWAMSQRPPAMGLHLEFGVASGKTINLIASCTKERVYGFDTFTGLPEDWRTGFAGGAFDQRGNLPEVSENVELIAGLFEDTLPPFMAKHGADKIAYLHVDCDLYSSSVTIFKNCVDRLVSGSIVVFDEYWNYGGWQHDEFKAFQEFVEFSGVSYSYIGFVPSSQQVAVRIN